MFQGFTVCCELLIASDFVLDQEKLCGVRAGRLASRTLPFRPV